MTNNIDLFHGTAACKLYSHGCKLNIKLGYCNAGERNQERSTDLKCQILSTLIIHVGCWSAVNLFNTRPFHFHLSKSGAPVAIAL